MKACTPLLTLTVRRIFLTPYRLVCLPVLSLPSPARGSNTSTLLHNGMVLVAGGQLAGPAPIAGVEIGMEKSLGLTHFSPFPFIAPQTTINTQGKIEFLFTAPEPAASFRLEVN